MHADAGIHVLCSRAWQSRMKRAMTVEWERWPVQDETGVIVARYCTIWCARASLWAADRGGNQYGPQRKHAAAVVPTSNRRNCDRSFFCTILSTTCHIQRFPFDAYAQLTPRRNNRTTFNLFFYFLSCYFSTFKNLSQHTLFGLKSVSTEKCGKSE